MIVYSAASSFDRYIASHRKHIHVHEHRCFLSVQDNFQAVSSEKKSLAVTVSASQKRLISSALG